MMKTKKPVWRIAMDSFRKGKFSYPGTFEASPLWLEYGNGTPVMDLASEGLFGMDISDIMAIDNDPPPSAGGGKNITPGMI